MLSISILCLCSALDGPTSTFNPRMGLGNGTRPGGDLKRSIRRPSPTHLRVLVQVAYVGGGFGGGGLDIHPDSRALTRWHSECNERVEMVDWNLIY